MTMDELRMRLSAIESDESTYSGITASEIPLLEELLTDKEAWMASRAVFALSRVPDPKAVTILSRVVADPRPEVRVAVAASLSKLRPQDANNILLTLLDDTELGVRKVAVKTVSGINNAAVHAKLRDIQARDPAPPIRDFAKTKLLELGL